SVLFTPMRQFRHQPRSTSRKSDRRPNAMNQTLLNSPEAIRGPADFFGPIALDLEEVERILASTLRSRRACVVELVGHLNRYRGKRLRPTLLLLTARACGRVTPAHHVLGAFVEMVHTATLVHDDVL